MKTSKDILKLPVISISEGEELGFVEDLVIDPTSKGVEFFFVADKLTNLVNKVLKFNNIKCIGINAITIQSKFELKNEEEYSGELEQCISLLEIIDKKVYTENGKELGKINDVIIEQMTRNILLFEVVDDGKKTKISASDVITCGQKAFIVREDFSENKKNKLSTQNTDSSNYKSQMNSQNISQKIRASFGNEKNKSENVFQQKQKEFLLGCTCNEMVLSEKGTIITRKGDVITADILSKITTQKKLTELIMKTSRKSFE